MRRVSIGQSKDQKRTSRSTRRHTLIGIAGLPQTPTHPDDEDTKLNGSFSSGNHVPFAPQKTPLPRIRKVNESVNGFDGEERASPSFLGSPYSAKPIIGGTQPIASPKRRYPTHQPRFSGLGILPSVKLNKPPRAVLSEHNCSMLSKSLTVKVAAPDVLKPPIPIFVQPDTKTHNESKSSETKDSCNTESVISALREKRKRIIGEDYVLTSDVHRVSKRRRHTIQVNAADVEAAMNGLEESAASGKRPATSSPGSDNGDEEVEKVTKKSKSDVPLPKIRAVGVRNPLEASLSSSRRYKERQIRERSLNTSRESSVSRRSFSGERFFDSVPTSRNTSVNNTPRNSITLDDDVVMSLERGSVSNTSTPYPGTSGRTTPCTDGEASDSKSTPPEKSKRCLLTKEGSSKRRLLPTSVKRDDFARVPRLSHQLTKEDFARDQKAQVDRVEQMLKEISEEYKTKQDSKKPPSLLGTSTAPATATVPTAASETTTSNLSVSSTVATSAASLKPSLGVQSQASAMTSAAATTTKPTAAVAGTSVTTAAVAGTSVTTAAVAGTSVTTAAMTETSVTTATVTGASATGAALSTTTTTSLVTSGIFSRSLATLATTSSTTPANSTPTSVTLFTLKPQTTPSEIAVTTASGLSSVAATTPQLLPPLDLKTKTNTVGAPKANPLASSMFSFGSKTTSVTPTTSGTPGLTSAVTVPVASHTASTPSTVGGFSFSDSAAKTGSALSSQAPSSGGISALPGGFKFGAPAVTSPTSVVQNTAQSTASCLQFAPKVTQVATNSAVSATKHALNAGPFDNTGSASQKGTAPAATGLFPFVPNNNNTVVSSASSTNSGFAFGQTSTKPVTTAPSGMFGQTNTTVQNPTSIFGTAPTTTKATGTFQFNAGKPGMSTAGIQFGASTAKPTVGGFKFGAATTNTQSTSPSSFQLNTATSNPPAATGFQFTAGTVTSTATSSVAPHFGTNNAAASSNNFAFGATAQSNPNKTLGFSTPNTTAQSVFTFGASKTATQSTGVFGNTAGGTAFGAVTTAAPAFGVTTTSTTPAFGSTPTPAFGSAPGFGSTKTTAPVFCSGTGPAFGTASATPGFGATTTTTAAPAAFGATSPAFGSTVASSAPAFGSSGAIPAFGANTAFGSAPAVAATSPFGEKSTVTAGQSSTVGFNFSMAQPTANPFNFAGGQQATATPNAFGPGAPAAFGTPATPNTGGMFTMGSSNTTPRPRVATVARRRRGARR